ncbi:MAG TPA: TAXI family TRAP transporter solute-binding subunit [Synergistaceae bacterium]|nr:TAXI family TRAP transporter solute-binding subunit [Synergistaceae bacterium]HPJ26853.1 TAXI family TRAP transporter solute-binding subunit [Synergistaceae bacterium]HPQ36912.1 TAXI family TRAP transporter solute-binding subunit [Synergistaceae bacterium]
MRKGLFFLMVLLLSLSLVTVAGAADKEGWPEHLRFMAGPPGGNWFALGGSLADMWSKTVLQTTSGTGGGVSNIINVDRAKGDFGLSVASVLGAAQKGEGAFKKPVAGTVNFANLYRQYTYFIMRKDYAEEHGITTLGDIVEKKLPIRMATLKPGTASEFIIRSIFEKGWGVNWEDVKSWGGSVEFASYDDGANLLADNHLDMFTFAVGRVASIVMKIESQTDVVILPVDEKARKAVAEAYGTTTFLVDKDAYESVTGDIPVVGDYTCIVIRKDLPDSLVYDLAKALWEAKNNLAKAVKDVGEMTAEEAFSPGVATHPGAVKFWTEAAK